MLCTLSKNIQLLPEEIKRKIFWCIPVDETKRQVFVELKRFIKIQNLMEELENEYKKNHIYFGKNVLRTWFLYYMSLWFDECQKEPVVTMIFHNENTSFSTVFACVMKLLYKLHDNEFLSCIHFASQKAGL